MDHNSDCFSIEASFVLLFGVEVTDLNNIVYRSKARKQRTTPLSDGLLAEVSGGFLSYKSNVRRSVHSPRDHFVITLIIGDRRDRRDTRGKWPSARDPDRSWWHHHTSSKRFWRQPMAPWTVGQLQCLVWNIMKTKFYCWMFLMKNKQSIIVTAPSH